MDGHLGPSSRWECLFTQTSRRWRAYCSGKREGWPMETPQYPGSANTSRRLKLIGTLNVARMLGCSNSKLLRACSDKEDK